MDEDTSIVVIADGPFRVTGSFVIKDAEGQEFDLAGRSATSLCRCGHSQSQPFCDGQHATAGFKSTVEARKLPPPAKKG